MGLWVCGFVGLWVRGSVGLSFGRLGLWVCVCVLSLHMFVYVCVVVWLCGCVFMCDCAFMDLYIWSVCKYGKYGMHPENQGASWSKSNKVRI